MLGNYKYIVYISIYFILLVLGYGNMTKLILGDKDLTTSDNIFILFILLVLFLLSIHIVRIFPVIFNTSIVKKCGLNDNEGKIIASYILLIIMFINYIIHIKFKYNEYLSIFTILYIVYMIYTYNISKYEKCTNKIGKYNNIILKRLFDGIIYTVMIILILFILCAISVKLDKNIHISNWIIDSNIF